MISMIVAAAGGFIGIVCVIWGTVFLNARTAEFQRLPHTTDVFDPPQARYGQPFAIIGVGLTLVCVAIIAAVVAFE